MVGVRERRRAIAAELAWLCDRGLRLRPQQEAILAVLAHDFCATKPQLAALTGLARKTVEDYLRELGGWGFVGPTPPPGGSAGGATSVFTLLPRGMAWLQHAGLLPASLDVERVDPGRVARAAHALGTVDVRVALVEAARRAGLPAPRWVGGRYIYAEMMALTLRDKGRLPIPDAFFALDGPGGGTTHGWLEYDTGSEMQSLVLDKVARYAGFLLARPAWDGRAPAFPGVFLVTRGETRLANLVRTLCRRPTGGARWFLTTAGRLAEVGAYGPAWVALERVGQPEYYNPAERWAIGALPGGGGAR